MEQWHWNILYSAGLLGISFYVITKHIRYHFGREFILNLFCKLQGRKHKWVREPNLARRVLSSSSSKGIGVEQLLSTEAFLPIVSLESVADDQWKRMKDNFVTVKSHLPSLDSLSTIAENITKYYCEQEENQVIDCPTLVKLIVQIMQAWLFGVAKEVQVNPMIIEAIEEYRKEIAIKGKGDPKLKLYVTHWIQDEIRNHKKIYEIFQEKWFSDEYWSLLLQPFFISPAINITDIAVTLTCKEFKEEFELGESGHEFDMERIIMCAINYKHPFPLFERWFPHGLKEGELFIIEPNTHVFIPIDEIGRSCYKRAANTNWSAFGAGKRACGGRDIAMTLCTKIFYVLLIHPKSEEKFKPWINHNYSGRDNDFKETLSQTYFQIVRLIQILWKLVRQRVELSDYNPRVTRLIKTQDSSLNMNLTTNSKDPTETEADDFLNDRTDRKIKYGIGTVRLSLIIIIFYWVENCSLDIFIVLGMRYGLFGIGGGLLNLHKFSFRYELLTLCVLIANFVHEYVYCSSSSRHTILFMYFLKTVIGDALAGKLDNVIWFKSVVIVLIVWTVLSSQRIISLLVLPNIFQVIEMFYQELFIFGPHLFFHWLCEMGDNHYQKYVFFRHRYSYEISCVILYLICNNDNNYDTLSTSTLLLFADMFASLLYRVTNYISLYY